MQFSGYIAVQPSMANEAVLEKTVAGYLLARRLKLRLYIQLITIMNSKRVRKDQFTFDMASEELDEDQGLNHLFDHFLPLLEKYLPVDAVATHLVQAGLLSRIEYLRLREVDAGKPSKRTSRIVRLVDNIASKGPRAFSLFYRTLEGIASAEDDGDIHLGLRHCVEEMDRVMKDKGCISRLQLEFETEHSASGSVLFTSLSAQGLRMGKSISKWSVSSAPQEQYTSRLALFSGSSASVSSINRQALPVQYIPHVGPAQFCLHSFIIHAA